MGFEEILHSDGRQLRHDLRQYVAAGTLLTEPMANDCRLDDLRSRIDSLRQIFLRLDELTRLDASPARSTPPVDVVGLVEECVSVVGLGRDGAIALTGEGQVAATCDPVMLRRAVTNVLDNAARAAGPLGTVQVRVARTSGDAVVEVSDDGEGFGRIASGSGQGMSIVQQALQACRGRLEITSGPGPGTTVRLHIPALVEPTAVS